MNPQIGQLVFGQAQQDEEVTGPQPVLVNVFLRGGADFLNMVVPSDGADRGHYEQARTVVGVPAAELLSLGDVPFGLHPSAAGLAQLFDEERLAIVMGAGLMADTRSHFDATRLMEYGASGDAPTRSGWLARMLPADPDNLVLLPAVALSGSAPASFVGSNRVVAVPSLSDLGFPANFRNWQAAQRSTIRRMYEGGQTAAHLAGQRTLAGSNVLELHSAQEYRPANGVEYPQNGFANALQDVAQLIKLDLGLSAATVDLGGWDTHANQGVGAGGFFGNRLALISDALAAFVADLDDRNGNADRTTVVVMSEFGRRVQQNASNGTDHGHGGVMFVMGGSVNGGLHGEWPGLAREQLYDGADLAVTTDYRRVLSDIAIRQFGNNALGGLFPGYTDHQPMGLVAGNDLEPDYSEAGPEAGEAGLVDGDEQLANSDEAIASDAVGTPVIEGDDSAVGKVAAGTGIGVLAGAALGATIAGRRRRSSDAADQGNPDTSVDRT